MKCINCQNTGNNEEGLFICYCLKSNFWMKEVLNKDFGNDPKNYCEHFDKIIDLDENFNTEENG